ncbi:winged helix-turn-helix domain-containing protein [Cumulibacter soli]|uniref:winged helix-turn-helix domain-containing protein n=1 Tax=Cumulibacter soli TaxID=2546344 RepID=UPI001FB94B60|nr:crosslink repair DNA glycosylase YcaQ family protein [Cumulibacter soli]
MRQISVPAARRIALAAQGFADRSTAPSPGPRQFARLYERTAIVQVDSVNVLTRAHYLPAFSRLGPYDRAAFDAMEHPRRRVFEYWGHMASYSPVQHHPLLRWRMAEHRTKTWGFIDRLVRENPAYVDDVRQLIAERGPLTSSQVDPQRTGKVRGEMWSWHDAKAAIEWLFRTGELASVRRNTQFERVYDLTERVIPREILDLPTPTCDDAQRELLEVAARAHGVATAQHLRDYFRITGRHTERLLDELVESGALQRVRLHGVEGQWFLHRDARIPRHVPRSALLAPFDPLVWERDRTQRLWDTHYRIEIYVPKPKRVRGYYVLPYLLDEQLAALVDLKADRAQRSLLVQAAHHIGTLDIRYVAQRLSEDLVKMAHWLDLVDVRIADVGDLSAQLRCVG